MAEEPHLVAGHRGLTALFSLIISRYIDLTRNIDDPRITPTQDHFTILDRYTAGTRNAAVVDHIIKNLFGRAGGHHHAPAIGPKRSGVGESVIDPLAVLVINGCFDRLFDSNIDQPLAIH